jgi:hypothetical protein
MKYARLTPGAGFMPLHAVLYYGQRMVTIPALRRTVVAALAAGVRLRRGTVACDPALLAERDRRVDALRRDGSVSLGRLLDERQCAQIRTYLYDKPMIDRRDNVSAFTVDAVPDGISMAEYRQDDVLACPHVLTLANSPALLAFAARYIGCKPTISSLWMRWSFPRPAGSNALQGFHRDSEDWRYLKVMLYLTDVDADGGPHVYVRGTHRDRMPLRLRNYSDADIERAYGARVQTVTDQAGCGFAVDTAGIHKGSVPSGQARLLLQIQYSLLPSYAYRYAPLALDRAPQLDPQFDPYINRLMIRA